MRDAKKQHDRRVEGAREFAVRKRTVRNKINRGI
jgi:hypothetical protein